LGFEQKELLSNWPERHKTTKQIEDKNDLSVLVHTDWALLIVVTVDHVFFLIRWIVGPKRVKHQIFIVIFSSKFKPD
jgi:hypothetical protein